MPVFLYLQCDQTSLTTTEAPLLEVVQDYEGEVCHCEEGGACILFLVGNPLECALSLQRRWKGGTPPKMAVHVAPVKQVQDKPQDPVIRHAQFLAEAASPGQILMSEPAAEILPLPRGAALQDLGQHMVKDLLPPQKIFQLVHVDLHFRDYPPPQTLSAFRHNLLSRTPPFIGRCQELTDIGELLRGPERLLTITGVGGIGKSRLAYQSAAANIEHFTHGVFFVPLIPVSAPHLMISAIADATNFSFHGRMNAQRQLLNYLRRKNMLLILDSFEHLLPYVELPLTIHNEAPQVTLLITSQRPLGVEQERVYTLSGLPYPPEETVEECEAYEAVELFLQVAHHIDPLFTLTPENARAIVEICHLVDGMPLGITLAATLVRILSCQEIATGVRQTLDFLKSSRQHLPKRHRSLRATFEYAWSLLSPEERTRISRLAVFWGGFQVEAATTLLDISPFILRRMREKSLLRCLPSGRCYVPTPLWQYTLERLQAQTETYNHYREEHAAYYAQQLHRATPSLWEASQQETLQQLIQELPNLSAMWHYAVETRDLKVLRQTAEGMYRIHEMRSHFHEGRELFEEATAMVRTLSATDPTPQQTGEELLALLLTYQGAFCYLQGAYKTARALLKESRTLLQHHNMQSELGFTLLYLGAVAHRQGQIQRARGLYEEAYTIFEKDGEDRGLASVYQELGKVSFIEGKYEATHDLFTRSVSIRRSLGDLWGTARLYQNWGSLALIQTRYAEAHTFFEKSLQVKQEYEDRWGISFAFSGLGVTAFEVGNYEEAQRHLQRSLALRRELGNDWATASSLDHLAYVLIALGDGDEAERLAREASILRRQINDQIGIAFSICLLATLSMVRGKYRDAEEGYREGLRMFRALNDRGGVRQATNGLGEALSVQGKLDEAFELFTTIRANCTEVSDQQCLVYALAGLGEVFAQRGQTRQAWSYYRAALHKAEQTHAPPLLLKVSYGIAKLHLQVGDREAALALLQRICAHPATAKPLHRQARALLAQWDGEPSSVPQPAAQVDSDPTGRLADVLLKSLPSTS